MAASTAAPASGNAANMASPSVRTTDTAVTIDRVAQEAEVELVDRVPRRAEGACESHRALDVGAQEGDGAGRQGTSRLGASAIEP